MSVSSEPFYLGAYWGPRTEAVEACAERLARCVESLGKSSDVMAVWFRKDTTESAKAPVTWDIPSVVDLLLAGRNRGDFGGKVIEGLGFRIALWNGDRSVPVGMSVTCGADARVAGIMNAFVLQLPKLVFNTPMNVGVNSGDTMRDSLLGIVDCWQPDWAVATSNSLRNAQEPLARAPHVGWLTYLSGQRPVPQRLPDTVSVERLRHGAVIALAEDPRDVTVESALAVRDALTHGGSLEPTSIA